MLSDPEACGPAGARGDEPTEPPRETVQREAVPRTVEVAEAADPDRYNPLLLSFITFFVIASGVWIVSGGKRYRAEYAEATQGWRVGTSRVVDLTMLPEDKVNLACASEHTVAGLSCAYGRPQSPESTLTADSPMMLQPYNTVSGELLLGAGLWTSPDLKQVLPSGRFAVVCNYNIKGVMGSAQVRFGDSAGFVRLSKTVTVGTLTECMIPR